MGCACRCDSVLRRLTSGGLSGEAASPPDRNRITPGHAFAVSRLGVGSEKAEELLQLRLHPVGVVVCQIILG